MGEGVCAVQQCPINCHIWRDIICFYTVYIMLYLLNRQQVLPTSCLINCI